MSVLPHEDVEVHRLERMPLTVRRKLAEAGAELDDAGWRGLPRLARQRLVDVHVDSAVERRAFRQLVGWLRETFLDGSVPPPGLAEPGIATHPWRAAAPPPAVTLSPEQWNALGVDLRYALVVAENDAERRRILGDLSD
jgi:hypothetical protein